MAQNNIQAIGNDFRLNRVMIARLSALGDVVMTVPVIYSVCLCYSSVHFTLLTSKVKSTIFINKPRNLTVVGIDVEDIKGYGNAKNILDDVSSDGKFDAFIDLQNDKSTRWLRLACLTRRIKVVKFNNAQAHKKQLSRRANKVMLPLVSSRDRYKEAFFKAGLPVDERFYGLYGKGNKAAPEEYASITTQRKDEGEKWIGIAPFAMYPQKEYPIDKMEEVIEMLQQLPKIRIFILGADGREKEQAQAWQQNYPSVTSLAGKNYGFPAEMALISNLDVLITMDSANMHLASIVRTPTISIWGATHHYCGFKGWHQSEDNMIQAPLSCRPCSINGDKPCYRHDLLCLTAIRPETIYTRIYELLGY